MNEQFPLRDIEAGPALGSARSPGYRPVPAGLRYTTGGGIELENRFGRRRSLSVAPVDSGLYGTGSSKGAGSVITVGHEVSLRRRTPASQTRKGPPTASFIGVGAFGPMLKEKARS